MDIKKKKKYKVFIRKGSSKGKKGDYFSATIDGTFAQARKIRDQKLAEFKLKINDSTKGNIKFLDFVRIYYHEYAEKELSPTTIASGKQGLKCYILPEIANMPLNKIDALVVQKILNKMKSQDKKSVNADGTTSKLSPTTVNGVYRLLRKILNKVVAWDYLDKNPVLKVKAPGVSKVEKQSYNKEELGYILNLLKNEDIVTQAMFTIAICTGLRRGEIAGLHIEDIDFENYIFHINRSVVWDKDNQVLVEKSPKTKGSVRDVPVPPFCMDIIREYMLSREKIEIKYKTRFGKNYNLPTNLFLGSKELFFSQIHFLRSGRNLEKNIRNYEMFPYMD